MNFNQLSWGTVCFYYRSNGDRKYSKIMSDTVFISKLREEPYDISLDEFEEKVLINHVNIENYELLIGHNLTRDILTKIIKLQPDISSLNTINLLGCDLSVNEITEKINRVYGGLYSIQGLWLTGVSKIAHLLNDRLFAILNLDISKHFKVIEGETSLTKWLELTQQNAREVTEDFYKQGFSGSPEEFLSDRLGYTAFGYKKSLVKFLDEFFWLRFGDDLPVPPRWIPPFIEEDLELK